MRPSFMLTTFFNTIQKIFYPPFCLHCEQPLVQYDFLCTRCASKLRYRSDIYCSKCGDLLKDYDCPTCAKSDFQFTQALAAYDLVPEIRSLIHYLKYKEMPKVGLFLGNLAGKYLLQYHPNKTFDIIVPVPLHKVKNKMRGYNQALWIAKGIHQVLGNELIPELIIRTRFTQTQTRLTRKRRIKNVSHAFMLNSKFNPENKTVLLVDDVFTTGSTMNEVSLALLQHKVNKIYAMTVAKA